MAKRGLMRHMRSSGGSKREMRKGAKVAGKRAKSRDSERDVREVIAKAHDYNEAAENWVRLKKPKRALKNYEKAIEFYETYLESDPVGGEPYATKQYNLHKGQAEQAKRDAERLKKVMRSEWRGLEGKTAMMATIAGILMGLFFLSPTLTGNAIANLTTKTSSIISGALFVIGIIGGYFWVKKR